MKTTVWFKKSLMALALVTLATPQLAYAASPGAAPVTKVHVQINDLNLSNSAGLEVLHQRLSNASRVVCGNDSDLKIVGSLKQLRLNKACFDATLAAALADVNFSTLAQATGYSIPSSS